MVHNEPAKEKMSGFFKLTNFQRLNFMVHLFIYGYVLSGLRDLLVEYYIRLN